ncbi:unnamed protein product [Phytophthora fragariaefolia]|uniref:Unnamed protein product n=1 Tax=Phytophthora fragariaefolia TaxID=1490495 RepID=A0A9W6X430_9STRA|nr:unnamed protein product [Phytophthora fragariaefolia]
MSRSGGCPRGAVRCELVFPPNRVVDALCPRPSWHIWSGTRYGFTCRDLYSVVRRKRNDCEYGAQHRRFRLDATEGILDNAVDAFRLTVGLRMFHGRLVQPSAKHRKEGRPKFASVKGVSIGDNCLRQAMLVVHTNEKRHSGTLTIVSGTAVRRAILINRLTKTTTPTLSAASGDRPNTKSTLVDYQHSENA